ncbi:hypothetical protein Zmor_012583 [Zophobas morio]|uniref:Amino acid transporter transmembrane domain-containing protein n=1 Tax=Zophobas morio TaxID=2755281 RepID=A0AA38IDV4_9CUCU|nr:hypothetical protein Zmor_012583 [Zophobas morio]
MFVSESSRMEEVFGEKPLNGYLTTMMHLVKGYVGTGIFAMGEGFKNSGMIMGPTLLLMIGIMNLNCQHILIATSQKISKEVGREVNPSFQETVEYTFDTSKLNILQKNAKRLGWMTNIFLLVCELGFCCVYFVFVANHVLEIAHNSGWLDAKDPFSIHLVLAVILVPMWASTFLGNLKLLLPLSVIANILIWIGIGIIFYFTTYEGLPPVEERKAVSHFSRWPLYFGTALYAFEGITFIIPLRNEMKNKDQFITKLGVLNVGMTFVFGLYMLVGSLAYWKYGDDVRSSVFLNLTEEDPSVSDAIDAIISIAIIFTFTLHMYIPFEISFPLFYRKYGPFKYPFLVMCIYRSVPVLVTWTMANIIPFLGLFISLVGATVGSVLALVIPSMLELVAFQGELSVWQIMKDIMVITIGIVGTITGSVLSLMDIVEKFRTEYFGGEE